MSVRRGRRCSQRSRGLIAAFAVVAAACQSDPTAPTFTPPRPVRPYLPPASGPRRDVERVPFHDGAGLQHLRELLVLPDGERLRHGREIEWYPGGVVRQERFFERDEPAGLWRSWYPDGARRSSVPCDRAPRTTTWWHANGRMSSQGQAVRGSKEGAWIHWHPSGAVAESGSYAGGLRQGQWTLWYEDGSLRARGSYRNDVRIGRWQWWSPEGELTESSTPAREPSAADER